MILGGITKTRKAKQFSYNPRHYNAEKEDLKNRIAQIEAEVNGQSTISSSAPISLKDKWQRNRKAPSVLEKKSNIRLAIIVTLLCSVVYWVLS